MAVNSRWAKNLSPSCTVCRGEGQTRVEAHGFAMLGAQKLQRRNIAECQCFSINRRDRPMVGQLHAVKRPVTWFSGGPITDVFGPLSPTCPVTLRPVPFLRWSSAAPAVRGDDARRGLPARLHRAGRRPVSPAVLILATLRRVAPAQTLPRGESGPEAGDGSVAQTCSSVLPRRIRHRFRRGSCFQKQNTGISFRACPRS